MRGGTVEASAVPVAVRRSSSTSLALDLPPKGWRGRGATKGTVPGLCRAGATQESRMTNGSCEGDDEGVL